MNIFTLSYVDLTWNVLYALFWIIIGKWSFNVLIANFVIAGGDLSSLANCMLPDY